MKNPEQEQAIQNLNIPTRIVISKAQLNSLTSHGSGIYESVENINGKRTTLYWNRISSNGDKVVLAIDKDTSTTVQPTFEEQVVLQALSNDSYSLQGSEVETAKELGVFASQDIEVRGRTLFAASKEALRVVESQIVYYGLDVCLVQE